MDIKNSDLKAWHSYAKLVFESTICNNDEDATLKHKRIELLKKDYGRFVAYYFPHYANSKCGAFQIDAANAICSDKKLRAVFEWARGHAKSTHFDLMIPMWLKARGELKMMILVGKSERNANTLLGDLQAELQNNQRYINDFGPQYNYGNWQEGKFVTEDDTAFFALGRGQSPRGLRHRNNRPDYIVVDDLDDDELVQNDSRVSLMVEWILTALFNTMDMGRGRFVMVGNRIHKNSVLAQVTKIPNIHHTIVNALDDNGEPSWREKYTREEIQEVITTIGMRRSQKEFFNNPISEGTVFKVGDIQFKAMLPIREYSCLVAYTDPSFRNTKLSDYKATVLIGRSPKGEYHVLKAFVQKCSVKEMVKWNYDLRKFAGDQVIVYYYMEGIFLQDILLDEFVKYGNDVGWQLPIKADTRSKPDKFQRIESIQPLFERKLFFFNEAEKDNPDMQRLVEQLLMFEKGSRMHDDGPDALEGAVYILNHKANSNFKIIIGKRGEGTYRNRHRY